jgi:peptide chain release factor 2
MRLAIPRIEPGTGTPRLGLGPIRLTSCGVAIYQHPISGGKSCPSSAPRSKSGCRASPTSSRSFEVIFDVEDKRTRIAELEKLSNAADFWQNQEQAQVVLQESADLQRVVDNFDRQIAALDDAEVLLELAEEEQDEDSVTEACDHLAAVEAAVERMEFERMLSGKMDAAHALLAINAGAGGIDAKDWAEMLQRMYLRWCQTRGYKTQLLDVNPADEAGINSCEILVEGDYAYGYLKAEAGVHRLVRISPFDAAARRHTSFASVAVYPDVDDSIVVEINEDDLRVDVYRASGAGGQHVNKTESAVRITHLPTGIVVQCQNERSQHKNRATAMRLLRSRLFEKAQREQEEKMDELHAKKMKIDFGSQIRSYVLAPYRLVTDVRTELKVGNVDAVLDGDLDPFIEAFLLQTGSTPE